MPGDPLMLQYLKSIDDKTTRIEEKLDKHDDRIGSLEDTRAKQRGIMIAGGTGVTLLSGFLSWLGKNQ